MLTDFSSRRPDIWPMLATELYEVHRLEPGSADVTEGSLYPAPITEFIGSYSALAEGPVGSSAFGLLPT
jgi:hypothetical protein